MTINPSSIRQIHIGDMPDIESILERSFETGDVRENYPKELDYLLRSGYNRYLLCADSGVDVVGFIHGDVDTSKGIVEYLAVDDEYRREGIGKSLIFELACRFGADGADSIVLTPTKDSIKFYRGIGFHTSGDSRMVASVDSILKHSHY